MIGIFKRLYWWYAYVCKDTGPIYCQYRTAIYNHLQLAPEGVTFYEITLAMGAKGNDYKKQFLCNVLDDMVEANMVKSEYDGQNVLYSC